MGGMCVLSLSYRVESVIGLTIIGLTTDATDELDWCGKWFLDQSYWSSKKGVDRVPGRVIGLTTDATFGLGV